MTYLNHGAFGATPRVVLQEQALLRDELESDPSAFLHFQFPTRIERVRNQLAAFLNADAGGIVFVRSATEGLNAVLRSLMLNPGDEILIANQSHHACFATASAVALRSQAKLAVVRLPENPSSPDEIVSAFTSGINEQTRVAVIDHVTSTTALVLPISAIVEELHHRGVIAIVDGAHGPGMLALSLRDTSADCYIGSLHKWVCAPKGAGFIYAGPSYRDILTPAVIARGGSYHERFDWTGTHDPTPWLCVPAAISAVDGMLDGGWPAIRDRNRTLARAGRDIVCEHLGIKDRIPAELLGSMFSVRVRHDELLRLDNDAAQLRFRTLFGIQVRFAAPITGDGWIVRASAFLYNDLDDYVNLAAALEEFGVRPL